MPFGRCAKMEVIAIIEKNGEYFVGSNHCDDAQVECPRRDLTTGSGYELCKNICKQRYHAEEDCCIKAGKENTVGNTLYMIGHYYRCDNCKKVMKEYGIKEVVFNKLPPNWNMNPDTNLIKKSIDKWYENLL